MSCPQIWNIEKEKDRGKEKERQRARARDQKQNLKGHFLLEEQLVKVFFLISGEKMRNPSDL